VTLPTYPYILRLNGFAFSQYHVIQPTRFTQAFMQKEKLPLEEAGAFVINEIILTNSFSTGNMHTSSAASQVSVEPTNLTIVNLNDLFDCFAWKNRDVRIDSFPLMSSIWPSVIICVIYIFLIKVVTPAHMQNRGPMDCSLFNRIYNSVQIIFHFTIGYSFFINHWDGGQGWCTLTNSTQDDDDMY
jgi:hypothetical protein